MSVVILRFLGYSNEHLPIILDNIPKNKNLQKLPDEENNAIVSYCDCNVNTKIGKEHIDDNEFIYILVEFENRGVCMR